MKTVDEISLSELSSMAASMYNSLVKAVVDLERKTLVVDAEMHADEEQFIDLVTDNNPDKDAIKSLDRYFLQFAIAARLHR